MHNLRITYFELIDVMHFFELHASMFCEYKLEMTTVFDLKRSGIGHNFDSSYTAYVYSYVFFCSFRSIPMIEFLYFYLVE
jgi:hypothetical protein